MTEIHPSFSAVGEFMDEETEIAALAQRYYEEQGRPEDRSLENWSRAEREVRARHAGMKVESGGKPTPEGPGKPPTVADLRTEEKMQLGV
jgi:hypothetical protein